MTKNWQDERPTPGAAKTWKVEYPEPLGSFLTDPIQDDLMAAIMEISAELWTVKKRLNALEKQLEESGHIVSLDLETGGRGDAPVQVRTAERDVFVNRIFGHLLADSPAHSQSTT